MMLKRNETVVDNTFLLIYNEVEDFYYKFLSIIRTYSNSLVADPIF